MATESNKGRVLTYYQHHVSLPFSSSTRTIPGLSPSLPSFRNHISPFLTHIRTTYLFARFQALELAVLPTCMAQSMSGKTI
ncbi:hypothetical protein L873DRAFT_1824255 [Choiromyces venosus 120613-1]|uniref:Uncharacterized protein n=1 Tax=Choiromyces venosus 120613-1 TaxID=1336337 RepID=A0A3N4J410_9PEZI|nr:hypothetical protein L873DRAFT_1824255 [Choiromyces venosus 120613-1]